MDPICHTLVGGALAATGLERKARAGRFTLLVAANLPDIDVAAHFWGRTAAYAFRRGITHGLPALVILPILFAAAVYAWNRWRPPPKDAPPNSFRWILALAAIGTASHPALDWLNTYGMRWLMPISDRWFYGDTLFIIDWIAWLLLAGGLLATRFLSRGPAGRPAWICLSVLVAYIAFNFGITKAAEAAARDALAADPPSRMMATPVPLNPLHRDLVLDYPDRYRFGSYGPGRGFETDPLEIPKGDPRDLERARQTVDGGRFLYWARFPYTERRTVDGKPVILVADARYIRDPDNRRFDGFAVITIPLHE